MTNEMTEEPEAILANELRFKEKLGLGEDAYNALKMANNLEKIVGVGGTASGGVLIASSSIVATTFFPAEAGLLAALGFGAVAVTPIGWVLAAGALTGGAYYGARILIDEMKRKRMTQIPKYINTPLDLIADQLLGLMLPLSIWIARADDQEVGGEERNSIGSHYSDEWGYGPAFVERAIERLTDKSGAGASTRTARELAKSLSEYCVHNKDCNTGHIIEFLVGHLNELVEPEGNHKYRERKLQAVRELESVFESL